VLAAAPGQAAQYNGFAKGALGESFFFSYPTSINILLLLAVQSCSGRRQGECIGVVRVEKYIWWNGDSSQALRDAVEPSNEELSG
jgi:hypothetical protein